MDLILWRHADALELRELSDDMDRSLTPKGERQAHRMAAWLNRQLPATTKVLCSPARRAQQTAAALERKVKTLPTLGPEGNVEALLNATRWPASRESVVVVGHQPTLGLAAAYLLAAQTEPWHIRKAGLWWLRVRERLGVQQVVLHAVMAPDMV